MDHRGLPARRQRGSRFYFGPKPPLDDDQAAAALFPFSFARPFSMTSISFSSCQIEELKSRVTFIDLSSVARR